MNVVIMRGIPGSGKTTYISRQKQRLLVCSADDFHMVDGVYRFDPSKAGEAHNSCLRKFLGGLLHTDVDAIFVDNTNLTAWEIAPYYRLAEVYNATVKIVYLHCDFEKAAQRQTHNVPVDKLWLMHQTLRSERLPSHWKQEIVFGG